MRKKAQESTVEVFNLILRAGHFKKTRYKSAIGNSVYVNPDAEFIVVTRIRSNQFGEPVIAYIYHNMKNHRAMSKNSAGYYIITLDHTFTIHEIVADTFIGPRPEGMEIDHKDEDKSNNHVTNLEYVTHAENMRRHYARQKAAGIKLTYKNHGKWMSKSQTFFAPDGEKIPMTEQEYIDHLLQTRGKTAVTRFLKRRKGGK